MSKQNTETNHTKNKHANARRGVVCNGCAVPLVRLRGTTAARLPVAVAPAGVRGIQ